jgi:hypothetical protein
MTNLEEQLGRVMEQAAGFWGVDRARVNIDDMVRSMERGIGGLVRCDGDPASAIRFFPMPERDMTGCIAGWISEES